MKLKNQLIPDNLQTFLGDICKELSEVEKWGILSTHRGQMIRKSLYQNHSGLQAC